MAVVIPVAKYISLFFFILITAKCNANDILGCGGFVKSHVSLDFSKIEIGLYTKAGSLKEKTECAPTNGYYFLPLYEKGEYILKVHPPAGWSFEPSEVKLLVDGETDRCSTGQDINFSFNGFGITGRVVTAGQKQGPSSISVELVDDKGNVRTTLTGAGGDFHFTPVIPGKYTLKASHPRWKLEPSQAVVQVKEGNTALPVGVLAVKGFDVKGSVTSFGSPISGLYVLLYSKEENPKFRVEGCNTALLQGVPDAPICHTVTDAAGEFNFGLVPAGDYKLLVLSTPPGQVSVTYNVKPDKVAFTVLHDSLYIKNAFEVTGFTLVGTTLNAVGGKGMKGVRVLLDGRPVGTTDSVGKFTLSNIQPGTYTLSYQYEQCEFEESQVVVNAGGPTRAVLGVAARWRVCGAVAPPHARPVLLPPAVATPGDDGKWCTYLPPGVYSAKVDVSEEEQRDGLQFYPLTQKVSVGNAPVDGIVFSQLKGRVTGKIICKVAADCASLTVTLRPLSVDGGYVGQPMSTVAKDGAYEFKEVLPGSVEVSVPATRLCWRDSRHNVALTQEHAVAPDFEHTGYVVRLQSTHDVEVEYKSAKTQGVLSVARGASQQCVQEAGPLQLQPRGCHRFQPSRVELHAGAEVPETAQLVAVAHAAVVRVTAPIAATDLRLQLQRDGRTEVVGPLAARPNPDGGYVYEYTLYLADGEECAVWATSESLLLQARGPQPLAGRGSCQPSAITLRAARALTLAGAIEPPVAGVAVTLTAEDLKLVHTTTEDGTYKFGPLDASKQYSIVAEKESYVFSAPAGADGGGIITAHKLAEITVELLDEEDQTPLLGALVSVSGGSYRRAAAAAGARLRFAALQPAQYYVKPHMKEYRFQPPSRVLDVAAGRTHHLTLKARRVAWSCRGALLALGGAGWPAAALLAAPALLPAQPTHCVPEEATTETDGTFRIRGLLPGCVYTIELKESSNPELAGLKLAKAPPTIEVKDKKDIENVRLIAVQPQQLTDASVLVRAATVEHYRSLRVALAADAATLSPLFTTRLDSSSAPSPAAPTAGLLVPLPRLPADNRTYVLQIESTLSKVTHVYEDAVHYFVSDGRFKHFEIDFFPKVKTSEQELRQSSLLAVPLLLALALAWWQRDALVARGRAAGGPGRGPRRGPRGPARPRARDVLDAASIDHIVSSVNAAGKRPAKRRFV
ncbi:LOW QUALITY PROTEIN: BOS complex subunit NOMO1 [Aphomia sociella]